MNQLPVTGADIVHLGRHTFMWVQVTHFGNAPNDDMSAIAALIASPGYNDDYASPLNADQRSALPVEATPYPPVHGRWWLNAVDAGSFVPTTAAAAENRIRSWADDQDWADPSYRQPPEVHQRLQPVFDLLRVGRVYTLLNPADDAMHEYGFATGGMGFHEFVVMNRTSATIHLVVASDD